MLGAFDFTTVDTPHSFSGAEASDDDSAPVSREDMKLLCEIGVLALAIERGEDALPIFKFIDAEQPHNAAGAIGIAMIEVAAGRERDACARLRSAIATRRLCVREAKAVLVVFLMGFGRHAEAKNLRRELLRGPECGARRLIQTYGAV